MSVAIKEIDFLPSYVCLYTHLINIFLSCISRVVAMDITSILKHVVEYLMQTAFMPMNAQILSLVDNKIKFMQECRFEFDDGCGNN